MISGKARDEIAELSADPIMEWVIELVRKEVEERLCEPCYRNVCGAPCPASLALVRHLTRVAWAGYTMMN